MKQKLTVMLALVTLMTFQGFSSRNNDWVVLAEEGGVKSFYQLGTCDNRDVLFLKFENTLNTDVKVDFTLISASSMPSLQIVEIKANETITGECVGTPDLIKNAPANISSLRVTMKILN